MARKLRDERFVLSEWNAGKATDPTIRFTGYGETGARYVA